MSSPINHSLLSVLEKYVFYLEKHNNNHKLFKIKKALECLMIFKEDIYNVEQVKSIKGGASRYSSQNSKEWFTENFSLYHMGREELVDPKFIEFLENEVLKWVH